MIVRILFICSCLIFPPLNASAQLPSAQEASGLEGARHLRERDQKLRESLKPQPDPKQDIENKALAPDRDTDAPKPHQVLIKEIHVIGNAILSKKEIDTIKAPFEGKELSLSQMRHVADLITDAYRQKGFITTRAILPPQKVTDHVLSIQVVPGVMGDLHIKGNRYFRKNILARRVSTKKGKPFNYHQLLNDLSLINQYPDRNVKTVIAPGEALGETDVFFEVKDRLPVHVGFAYDNFASRYIGKNRYTGTLTDNNLLGFDDIVSLQYQTGEAQAYQLTSIRYLFPAGRNTQIGLYAAQNQLDIGEEFKDLEARGKSKSYSVFINQTLLSQADLNVTASAGFDYKDVFNFQMGSETSRDRLRTPKAGFTVDYADPLNGRNIVSQELSCGVPNIMGGMRDTDPRSTRVGAGGQFTKSNLDVLRLQQMPFDTTLLLKGQAQFAGSILPASEQYQLGGATNVRGFAPGEAVGDDGRQFTAEWGFPLYGLPAASPIPFSKATLNDSLRLSAFYDWGQVHLRNPQAGEPKDKILDSLGWGVRLNLPDNFSFRVDFAWAVNGRPLDGHEQHSWVQVSKEF